MRRLLAAAVFACAFGAQAAAHAEVWGYVDDKGVAHFAAEKVDERYALFFRGGESFDTTQGVQPPRPAGAAGRATSKLLAYFDVSPTFKQVKQHLRDAAKEHHIEPELLQALIAAESGFDASAVSPKGAIGLMQIMPATAERYGLSGDAKLPLAKKLTDPRTNIRTGVRYLSDLIRMFPGQLELALAAYNAGEGAVQRAGNRVPNYPETQNYVKTVMQLYAMLKPAGLPATAAVAGGPVPRRIHMELPGPAIGVARRNMPPGFTPALPTDTAALPDPAGVRRD